MDTATVSTTWAGEVDYLAALAWQDALVQARQADRIADAMLLLSHPPTYTAGRHADLEANRTTAHPEIPVVRIDRGGDLTYHGPGQVVAYPILRLADSKAARRYVTGLETGIIDAVGVLGITADRRPGYPGVWVGSDKIAAIGVRVTGRVTKHGVAVNNAPDLDHFSGIIPCGITDGGVTSLLDLGVSVDDEELAEVLATSLAGALRLTPVTVTPASLGAPARSTPPIGSER